MSPETLTPLPSRRHASNRQPAHVSFSEKGQCRPLPCRRTEWRRKAFAGCSIHPGYSLSPQGSSPRTEYRGSERQTTWPFCLSRRTLPRLGLRKLATREDMKRLIQDPYYPACQVPSCSYKNALYLLFAPAASSCR